MLQVCIYRNSVRRALKSIAQAVEQLEATQAGAAETAQVARAVMNVVTQIAQSLHRLQLVRPLLQHSTLQVHVPLIRESMAST